MVLSARAIVKLKIKARLETFLDDTCTIKRPKKTKDSMGARQGALEIVASSVACRVIAGKSDIEDIGEQQAMTEWYRLIVPVGTDLAAGYVVVLADGTEYRVIDLITQRSDAMDAQAMIKREVR